MFIETQVAQTIGATVNMSPINNREVIIHSVKSFGIDPVASYDLSIDNEVSKTLTCSHGRNCAGALTIKQKSVKAFGIDQQGGKGGANYTEDVAPTICSDSHGTPHAVCKITTPIVLNFQGSKGNNVVSQDGTCPTINSMHGHDVHVVCVPINSMVIGKDGGNGDRQTFGIGDDGDPCPTIQTCHHHAVAVSRRPA